jgi:uncharacterized protein YegP (UPF0339 family)
MIITKEGMIKFEEGEPNMRSCWECNPAHNHLKKLKVITGCFSCGRYFINGKFLLDISTEEMYSFMKQSMREGCKIKIEGETMVKTMTFKVFKDKKGGWRLRLVSGNGRKLMVSESYTRKATAEKIRDRIVSELTKVNG